MSKNNTLKLSKDLDELNMFEIKSIIRMLDMTKEQVEDIFFR